MPIFDTLPERGRSERMALMILGAEYLAGGLAYGCCRHHNGGRGALPTGKTAIYTALPWGVAIPPQGRLHMAC
ncbi:hypothetical protein [Halomonas caseinilytica]|nr:hypothetical protein [Halomonas caseinilytica]